MTYFPKSQIKTDLYTNGEEFSVASTSTPYKGYYYKISNGTLYTGKSPGDGLNELLTPISQFPQGNIDGDVDNVNQILILSQLYENFPDSPESHIEYSDILNVNTFPLRSLPQPYQTLPTPQNYEDKIFFRYFTKKTNELKYKEISKQTYTLLKNRDNSIAWDLYEPVKLEWEIRGDKSIIFRNNKTTITKIEQNKKWYGFSNYLKEDYTKYWKP